MDQHTGSRELPGHIKARLDRLKIAPGGATDSAGIPWAGRDLSGPGNPLHKFDHDDGLIDPEVKAGWEQFLLSGDEAAVVEALAQAKVYAAILPTVVEPVEAVEGLVGDKEADVALVSVSAADGRKTLPIFTSVQQLTSWHEQARPVAVYAPRAALAAVAEGAELLVLDPGSDTPFVIRRPAVWALAQQRQWTPSYRNQRVGEEISAVVQLMPRIHQARLQPDAGILTRSAEVGNLLGGGCGPELHIILSFVPGTSAQQREADIRYLHQVLSADPEFMELVDSLHITATDAEVH